LVTHEPQVLLTVRASRNMTVFAIRASEKEPGGSQGGREDSRVSLS